MDFQIRDERRKLERIKIELPVQYSPKEQPPGLFSRRHHCARTLDLSEEGATLLCDHFVAQHEKILINFPIAETIGKRTVNKTIHLEGEVTSVIVMGEGVYRLGVWFGKTNEEQEDKFFDIICGAASEHLDAERINYLTNSLESVRRVNAGRFRRFYKSLSKFSCFF